MSATQATRPVASELVEQPPTDPLHCIELALKAIDKGAKSGRFRPPDGEPEWEPGWWLKTWSYVRGRQLWHDVPVDDIDVDVSLAGHIYVDTIRIWTHHDSRRVRVTIMDSTLVEPAVAMLRAAGAIGGQEHRAKDATGREGVSVTCYYRPR